MGGGGREHAIAWRLAKDDSRTEIIAAPGNPGIATLGECVAVTATDIDALIALARERRVHVTVVGPEAPLASGIVNRFREEKLPVFGPTREAAEIETSKAFAKELMREAGVPTARAFIFTERDRARGAVRELGAPVVVKASGLAAGKGVIVCHSIEEADRAIDDMLVRGVFGGAGTQVLVEEFMEGEELSVLAITDGANTVILPPAQDHKRLGEGDTGPNTGGMGAYAPVAIASADLLERVRIEILEPTLAALSSRDRAFTGVLYAGLMLTAEGPRVVEFNCRFGDPETQAILPIATLKDGLLPLLAAVANGEGVENDIVLPAACGVTTVVAAGGYPGKPRTGDPVELPEDAEGEIVFHAGTALRSTGELVTTGGRVVACTGIAETFEEARRRSIDCASRVQFEGCQYRSDIGWREVSRHARAT